MITDKEALRTYYVVETEYGEAESIEVNTIKEARRELKRCLQYYKENMSNGKPPCKLMIVKYTELDDIVYSEEVK